ncbi:MAG: c-type cytochrome [Magnetovibrio sp.]|nr:c-type cytochrome [Magnetovibrio sp.]
MNKPIVIMAGIGSAVIVAGALYFSAAPQSAQASIDQFDPQVIANGKELYLQFCASCHGEDLKGQPNWKVTKADGSLPAPPHDKSGHTWHHSDEILFNYIKGGGASLGLKDFKSGMPPFKSMMDDTEIWSALAYIKSRWPAKHRARQAAATEQAKQAAQN